MFMMHFVCPAYSTNVRVITPGKPFETLVNDHFMHYEIRNAVHGKTSTDTDHPVLFINDAQHNEQPAGYGKYEKVGIILFKKTRAFLVMVLVQSPTKAVHDVAVQAPGKSFHQDEGGECDQYVYNEGHQNLFHKSAQDQKEHELNQ
jgi:hypothetical protein